MRRGRAARGPAIVLLRDRQLVPPGKKAQQPTPRKKQVAFLGVLMASVHVGRVLLLGKVLLQDKVRRMMRRFCVVMECLAEHLADRNTTGELLDTEDHLIAHILKV